jgi:hypothetical protein
MSSEIGRNLLLSLVVDLQHKIHELPNEWNGPDAGSLNSIRGQFLEIPNQFFSNPASVSETQELVHTVVLLFLKKINGIPDCKEIEYCKKVIAPLSELQFIQLPQELSLETLLLLPAEDLLKMRSICKYYKTFIDSSPELQTKIAHRYLQKMQPECHIPLNDLKIDMTHHKLSVEVDGNLCLWKLTQKSSHPELNKTIPWISHLIVKEGKQKELTELFTQLQQSTRLVTLYLLNCEVDSKAIEALQLLLIPNDQGLKPPVLYLCNLRPIACELPSQLSNSSSNVVMIDSSKTGEYSIEKFLTKESDWIDLKELDSQVQNESFSGEWILRKMKEMHPIIQTGIISSIWHSKLTPTSGATPQISRNVIRKKVFDFVSDEPHHPAVRVAVRKNLENIQNGPWKKV